LPGRSTPDGSNYGFQANTQRIVANQEKFDGWVAEP